jgi:hypothetical protein
LIGGEIVTAAISSFCPHELEAQRMLIVPPNRRPDGEELVTSPTWLTRRLERRHIVPILISMLLLVAAAAISYKMTRP